MDRALWLLLGLRLKAWFRRFGRSLRTVKGISLTVVGLFVFLPWMASVFMAGRTMHDPGQLERVRRFGPPMLLAYCLVTLLFSTGERGLVFSPAEVNFLFAGPFRRRRILIYKIAISIGAGLLMSAFMAAVMSPNSARYDTAYVGMFLALLFIQLFAMAVALLTATVGEIASTWRRRLALAAIAALVGAAAWQVGREALDVSAVELLGRLERAPAVQAALTPFRWFVLAFTAERIWPDLVHWGGLSLAVDLALLAFVLALDAQYLESAAAASAKVYARIEKARRGTWAFEPMRRRPSARRLRGLPTLPWWGGIGPIAWRQLTTAQRGLGHLAILLAVVGTSAAFLFLGANAREAGPVALGVVMGLIGWLTIFLTTALPFDFRGDIDRIEVLKTLPIAPTRLAAGQLVAPVALLTSLQWGLLALLSMATGKVEPVAVAVAAFAVPFNTLLFAVENLIFLWFPTRMVASNPGDLQVMGRVVLLLMAKLFGVGLAVGIAALPGLAAYYLAGGSWLAAGAAAWVGVAGLAMSLVPLIAIAFNRFDVARDTPP